MAKAGALKINIIGDTTGLSKGYNRAQKQTQGFAGKIGKLGRGFGALQAVAASAVVGFGTSATLEFARVEKAWAEVTTLMPGKSKESLAKMESDVRAFATRTGADISDVMSATYQSISASIPAEDTLDFMATAHDAALAGATDLTTTVDTLSSVVNGYGLNATEAARIGDQIQTTVRLGKTTWSELGGVMSELVPISSSLGISLDQPLAAITALTAQGEPTASAGVKIRQMFLELSKAGSTASVAFEELSGRTFADFIDAGGDVSQAIGLMATHAGSTGIAVSDMFSSSEAGLAAVMLSGENAMETMRTNNAEIINSQGALADASETMKNTTSHQIDLLKAKWTEFKLRLGGIIVKTIGYLRQAWSWVGDTLIPYLKEKWGGMFNDIKTTFTAIAQYAVTFVTGVVSFFQTGFGQRIIDIVKFVFENFIARIRLGFQIIGGVFQIATNILKGNWGGAWDALKNMLGNVWDAIVEQTRRAWNLLSGMLGGAINAIMTKLYFAFGKYVRFMGNVWKTILDGISWYINKAIGLINGLIGGINKVSGWLSKIVPGWDGTNIQEITFRANLGSLTDILTGFNPIWKKKDFTWHGGKNKAESVKDYGEQKNVGPGGISAEQMQNEINTAKKMALGEETTTGINDLILSGEDVTLDLDDTNLDLGGGGGGTSLSDAPVIELEPEGPTTGVGTTAEVADIVNKLTESKLDEQEKKREVPETVKFQITLPDQTEATVEIATADLLDGNDRQVRAKAGSRSTTSAGACA